MASSPMLTSRSILTRTTSFLSYRPVPHPLTTTTSFPHPHLRTLHLAPPFLLDDYTPRYTHLTSVAAAQKRSAAYSALKSCTLCPRLCTVNRNATTGHCLIGAHPSGDGSVVTVSTIAPHFGEEPCIQGHNGSGAVFFSGCNLRCVFCQNHDVAHRKAGFELTPGELAGWMVRLQDVGNVHNINFVTPEHVSASVALAILDAREMGLTVPIVYNTSAYDGMESLRLMDGLVDIYLPDFKVWDEGLGKRLLKADNYAAVARESITEMYRQVGDLCFTSDGIAKKGVLVRHLVMPGKEEEGARIVEWLAESVSKDTFVNIMEQYYPDAHVGKTGRGTKSSGKIRYEDINRHVNKEEIGVVQKAARDVGLWRLVEPARHDGFNM